MNPFHRTFKILGSKSETQKQLFFTPPLSTWNWAFNIELTATASSGNE